MPVGSTNTIESMDLFNRVISGRKSNMLFFYWEGNLIPWMTL